MSQQYIYFKLHYPFSTGTAESLFLFEPTNITILEGESIRMNCTTTMHMPDDIVIWILNGRQYYWSDFSDLDVYTLDLVDYSLTINNAPRTLDKTSFQCVVNDHQLSAIGYLTVLYTVSSSSSSTSAVPITRSTTLSRVSIGS